MAELLSDTLDVQIDTWDDPGDYPNAVASGPLPSYDYVECVEGEMTFRLTPEEVAEYLEMKGDGEDDTPVQDFINDTLDPGYPTGITSAKWEHRLEDDVLTISIGEDFESDLGEFDERYDPY